MVLDQEEVLHWDGGGDGGGRGSSAAQGTGSGADLLWAALLCCCLGLKDGHSQAEPGAELGLQLAGLLFFWQGVLATT